MFFVRVKKGNLVIIKTKISFRWIRVLYKWWNYEVLENINIYLILKLSGFLKKVLIVKVRNYRERLYNIKNKNKINNRYGENIYNW